MLNNHFKYIKTQLSSLKRINELYYVNSITIAYRKVEIYSRTFSQSANTISREINQMLKTKTNLKISFRVILWCGFLFFIYAAFFPIKAQSQNHLLLLYSGNVHGEIEGCG
jgi:hypothetical protein